MGQHTAANAVPAIDGTDLDDVLMDLDGFAWLPGIAKILAGYQEIAEAATSGQLTTDHTQILLTLIANPEKTDLTRLTDALVQHLTGNTNQALTTLPAEVRQTLADLGAIHAFESTNYAPRAYTNEAAGLISDQEGNRS